MHPLPGPATAALAPNGLVNLDLSALVLSRTGAYTGLDCEKTLAVKTHSDCALETRLSAGSQRQEVAVTKNGKGRARSRPARHGMPRVVWACLAGLLLVVIGLLTWHPWDQSPATQVVAPQAAGQPRLRVDREQIDFGRVALDKPVKATFKLTNVGDQQLVLAGLPLVEVKKGC
jgi:hypothetical protein